MGFFFFVHHCENRQTRTGLNCADLVFWEIFSKRFCPFSHQFDIPISAIDSYFNCVKNQAQISKCMPVPAACILISLHSQTYTLDH